MKIIRRLPSFENNLCESLILQLLNTDEVGQWLNISNKHMKLNSKLLMYIMIPYDIGSQFFIYNDFNNRSKSTHTRAKLTRIPWSN